MEIKKEILDDLIKDLIGETGLLKQLTKALMERALAAELTPTWGYEKHDPAGYNSGNSRNGTTPKTVQGDFGEIVVETPRTGMEVSSRACCKSTRLGLMPLMTRSCPCARGA